MQCFVDINSILKDSEVGEITGINRGGISGLRLKQVQIKLIL